MAAILGAAASAASPAARISPELVGFQALPDRGAVDRVPKRCIIAPLCGWLTALIERQHGAMTREAHPARSLTIRSR